jgi:hypothetical protein
MDLIKIPGILEYPDWGNASVPEVAGQLLSRFVLAHPMPNANHRTGIGLVERYLRSHQESVTVPDTGEQGTWYEWARSYIHDSKRLLTVRRNAHVFNYAHEFGVDIIRRKNNVGIALEEFDLTTDSPFEHVSALHEARSIGFIRTVLEESAADGLRDVSDSGWQTFVGELRED